MGKGTPRPFALSYDGGMNNPSGWKLPDGTACGGEDVSWDRRYFGDMPPGQTFAVDVPMCGGAEGFLFRCESRTEGLVLMATSPAGVTYEAHDLGVIDHQHVLSRGMVGPRTTGGNEGPAGLEWGHWTVTLANPTARQVDRVTLRVYMAMCSPEWQTAYIPEVDWVTYGWPDWPYSRGQVSA